MEAGRGGDSTRAEMNTFHHFSRLPTELRWMVWNSAHIPRVVEVRRNPQQLILGPHTHQKRPGLSSYGTPVPAIVHTCREARDRGGYRKAFSELDLCDGKGLRYIWVNLEIDLISIGDLDLIWRFFPIAPLIQKPMFCAGSYSSHDFRIRRHELQKFTNLKEVHTISSAYKLEDGRYEYMRFYWPRGFMKEFLDDSYRVADERMLYADKRILDGNRRKKEDVRHTATCQEDPFGYDDFERRRHFAVGPWWYHPSRLT
ncbi:hypothetical protein NPX13_g1685 [Xylaria arbuscula]|uniref:2EXR domain-containing protein n=1 Tax=Xylaria arbuscula TaxID=114810 RepID=A0A9W8TRN7_9PEZI|nr:hypothetical protein NPX13_g1685 [Xylaria arbuscula]